MGAGNAGVSTGNVWLFLSHLLHGIVWYKHRRISALLNASLGIKNVSVVLSCLSHVIYEREKIRSYFSSPCPSANRIPYALVDNKDEKNHWLLRKGGTQVKLVLKCFAFPVDLSLQRAAWNTHDCVNPHSGTGLDILKHAHTHFLFSSCREDHELYLLSLSLSMDSHKLAVLGTSHQTPPYLGALEVL